MKKLLLALTAITSINAFAYAPGEKYIVVKNVGAMEANSTVQIQPVNCANHSFNENQGKQSQPFRLASGAQGTYHLTYQSQTDGTCSGPDASPISQIGMPGGMLITRISDIYGMDYLNSFDRPTGYANINQGDTICIEYNPNDNVTPIRNVRFLNGRVYGQGCDFAPTPPAQSCANDKIWNINDTYNGNDKVIYLGAEYQAKWWVSGEDVPGVGRKDGADSAWKYTHNCTDAPTPPAPKPQPTGNFKTYPDGRGTYSEGTIVIGPDSLHYKCKVAGWCNQGGAYDPSTGWAWSSAWEQL